VSAHAGLPASKNRFDLVGGRGRVATRHADIMDLAPAAVIAGGRLVLAASGFLLMLRAWWLFRVHGTAICPTAHTTALITNDIYRLTRNPMYLGIVLMLLGTALVSGGLFFYLATMSFFLIINFVFCQYEETKLIGLFGQEFARYRQRVRRWL